MPFIKANGCKLYYTDQGQGTAILFIHPPGLTHINFKYQMDELAEYFRVITFDVRGHGRSSYSEQALTYHLIAEDIKQLLDQLEIQSAFICGYSAGGSIALEFLLSQRERAIGGIVISGMSEVNDWVLSDRMKLGIAFCKARAISTLTFSICLTNSNTQTLFWKMFRESRRGKAKNIDQYYRNGLSYNCTPQLGKIQHPVLLVYGKEDHGFHPYARLLHDQLPHNELKVIENVKHQIPTKAAFELNQYIKNFIRKHTQE